MPRRSSARRSRGPPAPTSSSDPSLAGTSPRARRSRPTTVRISMTHVDRILTLAIAAGCMLAAPPAHADSAGAEALFRDGRTLIKQGNLDAGCDKLEASEKLESSVGTLLNLGDCREKQGRVATAWAAFRKAESTAKLAGNDKKRQLEAHRRAAKLEDSLA